MGIRAALERIGACGESLAWVGDRDLDRAWDECPDPTWMLWLLDQAEEFEHDRAAMDRESTDGPCVSLAHSRAAVDWDMASTAYWAARERGHSVAVCANAIRLRFPEPTNAVRRLIAEQERTIASDTATANAANVTDTRED